MREQNRPMFRPPGEADSLILQVDTGCPHNGCAFCGMYKGIPFRRRDLATVGGMIEALPACERRARRIFLADGDVMARSCDDLRALLDLLNSRFPDLARVSLYANGSSIVAKSDDQLRELRRLKLHTLYMGLETGDDALLCSCGKRETVEVMTEACIRAQAAGLRMSVMILLGLGGRSGSAAHIRATAAALNRMHPRLLSVLRVIPVEGTALYAQSRDGRFEPVSEEGAVRELRDLLAGLTLEKCVFRANHGSNVAPLEGRLPQDRESLVAVLDAMLASGRLDRSGPGRLPLWL